MIAQARVRALVYSRLSAPQESHMKSLVWISEQSVNHWDNCTVEVTMSENGGVHTSDAIHGSDACGTKPTGKSQRQVYMQEGYSGIRTLCIQLHHLGENSLQTGMST